MQEIWVQSQGWEDLLEKGMVTLRDMGSIPGLGSFPGVGNSNSLQNSCLENSIDRGDWWIAKSQT